MATGSVYIDATIKDPERGKSVVFGRVLVGENSTIRPQDLGLRTIKTIFLQPWNMLPGAGGITQGNAAIRGAVLMAGSIGSLGVFDTSIAAATPIGNYVRVRALRLTGTDFGGDHTGTWRLGTVAGSIRASYFAVGE